LNHGFSLLCEIKLSPRIKAILTLNFILQDLEELNNCLLHKLNCRIARTLIYIRHHKFKALRLKIREKPTTKPKSSFPFKWIIAFVLLMVLVLIFVALSASSVLRMREKANATEATTNARQIMLAMCEFETE
jgi:hypothetical protein